MITQTINIFRNNLASLVVGGVLALSLAAFFGDTTQAVNVIKDNNTGYFQQATNQDIRKTDTVTNITNILLMALGFIAVIAIIIAGIRYVLANGDASKIKSSKDIILYAVVGLIVAVMAWGIVNFVVTRF